MLEKIDNYLEIRKEDFKKYADINKEYNDVADKIRLVRVKETIDLSRLIISRSFKVIKHDFYGITGYYVLFNDLLFGFISPTLIFNIDDDGKINNLYSRKDNSNIENDYINLPYEINNENQFENNLYIILRDICLKSFMYSNTNSNHYETTSNLYECIENNNSLEKIDFYLTNDIRNLIEPIIQKVNNNEDNKSTAMSYVLTIKSKLGLVIYEDLNPIFILNDKYFYNNVDKVFIPLDNKKVFQSNISKCIRISQGHKHKNLFNILCKEITKIIKQRK